jgi:Ca-activated chloride channel homolog
MGKLSSRRASWLAALLAGLAAVGAWRLAVRAEALPFRVAGAAWRIAEPGWLLLLLLAIPHLLLRRPGGRSRKQRLVLGLRLTWLALAILALAGPALERRRSEVSVVALVDVSSSVAAPDLEHAQVLLARLEAEGHGRGRAVQVSLGRFSAAPVPVGPLPGGTDRARLATARLAAADDSDLALALGSALARIEPDRVGRVLLLSDGRPTRGDLLMEAERARRRGVRVFVHPFAGPSSAEPDVALASLTAPGTVRPGESFELEARVVATGAGTARFRLSRDGQPPGPQGERELTLAPGISLLRFTTRLESEAPARYRLEVAAATHDREPRNDAIVLAVAPEARPRVLVAESAPGSTQAFRRALAAEQIDVQATVGLKLPDPDRLEALDLIVLSDLQAAPGGASAAALDRFVREQGGGLLVTGPGPPPGRSRFEAMLPLAYDPTEQKEEATLALGLIIDRSGSMSGPKMDLTKEAARGAAELMNAQDLITVVTFDSQAQTVVRLQPASNRQRILSDIAQVRASGGTNVLPGLQEAFDQLLAARARKKHAIVLSDGQSPAEGVRELVDEAAAAGITVSAVGVGDGADLALLQTIAARGGGRFYQTRDPASIPRIFTRETTRFSPSNLVEAPSRIRTIRPAQATAGIPFDAAPPLGGYARARVRAGAEVLLASGNGDPLLARWQLGLGQALVWTSDITPRWSGEWLRWRHWNKLWAQVARSALRRGGGQSLPMSVALQTDRAIVQIRAFDAEDRPLAGLQGRLAVTDVAGTGPLPGRPTRSLPLAPGGAGIYRAEVPLHQAAALLLSGELRGDSAAGPVRLSAQGRLAVPPLRERLPPGAEQASDGLVGRALLAAVAARTGGGEIGEDLAPLLEPGSDRVTVWWPLWRVLLAAAVALFLAEIAARRANFRRPDRGQAMSPAARSS